MRSGFLCVLLALGGAPLVASAAADSERGPGGRAWVELDAQGQLQDVVWGEALQQESEAIRRAIRARLAGLDWLLGSAATGAHRVGTTVNLGTQFEPAGERVVLRLDSIATGIAYARVEPPRYPGKSLRNLDQADVLARVGVNAEGRADRIELQVKAKFPGNFEGPVRAALQQWRFVPEQRDGQAVAGELWVPIRFSLRCSRGDRDFAFSPGPLPGLVDLAGEARMGELVEITASRSRRMPKDCEPRPAASR